MPLVQMVDSSDQRGDRHAQAAGGHDIHPVSEFVLGAAYDALHQPGIAIHDPGSYRILAVASHHGRGYLELDLGKLRSGAEERIESWR